MNISTLKIHGLQNLFFNDFKSDEGDDEDCNEDEDGDDVGDEDLNGDEYGNDEDRNGDDNLKKRKPIQLLSSQMERKSGGRVMKSTI